MLREITKYFPLLIAFISFVFGLIFIIRGFRNYRTQIYLGIILMGLSVRLLIQTIFWIDLQFDNREYILILGFVQFGILPSVYLHLKSLLNDEDQNEWSTLLHFTPLIIVFLSLTIPLVILGEKPEKFVDYSSSLWNMPTVLPLRFLHVSFLILSLGYLYKNFQLLLSAFANGKLLGTHGKLIGQWALFVLFPLSMLFMLFLESFISIAMGVQIQMNLEPSLFIRSIFIAVILSIILRNEALQFGIPQLQIDEENPLTGVANSSDVQEKGVWIKSMEHENIKLTQRLFQSQENIDRMIEWIDAFVNKNQPFRDPNFGIDDLSKAVKIPSHHLRYIFKYHSRMGFVNYRNYCRMEDMIHHMLDHNTQNFTLEALALEHGFGSHSVLLRTFKLHYNATPTEVIQSKINSV